MASSTERLIRFEFQRSRGRLENTASTASSFATGSLNVNELRKLWQDRALISGENLGPGDPGDFDIGAWHISCHLVAAGGVCASRDGKLLWLEISHAGRPDEYYASVTSRTREDRIETYRLESAEGRSLLQGSTILGYVEGNSKGRTSSRGIADSPGVFNLCRRQDYDQPAGSSASGGKVWEHWCTLRDIRHTSSMATSIMSGYVALVSVLGDEFACTVARGRSQYGHPVQLAALVYDPGHGIVWVGFTILQCRELVSLRLLLRETNQARLDANHLFLQPSLG
jgi:hypothetical protein